MILADSSAAVLSPAKATRKPKMGRKGKPCAICGKRHSPWWNGSKGRWFLSTPKAEGGFQQINLGPDHDTAISMWHSIEAKVITVTQEAVTDYETIRVDRLCNLFLDDYSEGGPHRVRNVTATLKSFAKQFGGDTVKSLRVGGVARIRQWLRKQGWNQTTTGGVVTIIKQPFNWATKVGYLASNPIKALERPQAIPRASWFTAEQVTAIFAASPCQEFTEIFTVLLLTGARPEEICSLTKANIHHDRGGMYLMVDHKTQKKTNGKQRRIELPPQAVAIITGWLAKWTTGAIFRRYGRQIDAGWINEQFRKATATEACVALGLDKGEVRGNKKWHDYVVYSARHTFATRLLVGHYGVSKTYAEIAKLMGNSAAEVEKTYGHLGDQTDHLAKGLANIKV
jgi:integrase